jgi:hypothetical protein
MAHKKYHRSHVNNKGTIATGHVQSDFFNCFFFILMIIWFRENSMSVRPIKLGVQTFNVISKHFFYKYSKIYQR